MRFDLGRCHYYFDITIYSYHTIVLLLDYTVPKLSSTEAVSEDSSREIHTRVASPCCGENN